MSENITNNPSVPSQVVAEVKFPRFINNLGIIPTSYKDSMDYYQTLAWLCKYLEETINPTVNQNGDAVEELQGLYVELNNYVTHYFDNLDVQEEINIKLDHMASSGQLSALLDPIVNDKFEEIEESITEFENQTNETLITYKNQLDGVASGAPIPVGSTSDMTDTSKIYVLTSSGYWYYYNTSTTSWTAGGVYQASVDPDSLANLISITALKTPFDSSNCRIGGISNTQGQEPTYIGNVKRANLLKDDIFNMAVGDSIEATGAFSFTVSFLDSNNLYQGEIAGGFRKKFVATESCRVIVAFKKDDNSDFGSGDLDLMGQTTYYILNNYIGKQANKVESLVNSNKFLYDKTESIFLNLLNPASVQENKQVQTTRLTGDNYNTATFTNNTNVFSITPMLLLKNQTYYFKLGYTGVGNIILWNPEDGVFIRQYKMTDYGTHNESYGTYTIWTYSITPTQDVYMSFNSQMLGGDYDEVCMIGTSNHMDQFVAYNSPKIYASLAEYTQVLRVGTGKPYTTLISALNYLKNKEFNKALIYLYAGTYDYNTEVGDGGNYTGYEIPNNVDIIGIDNPVIRYNKTTANNTCATLIDPLNNTFQNITFEAYNVRYALHDDNHNDRGYTTTKYINCNFIHNGGNGAIVEGTACGCGFGFHHNVEFINCNIEGSQQISNINAGNGISIHGSNKQGSVWKLVGCQITSKSTGHDIRIAPYGTDTSTGNLIIENTLFKNVYIDYSESYSEDVNNVTINIDNDNTILLDLNTDLPFNNYFSNNIKKYNYDSNFNVGDIVNFDNYTLSSVSSLFNFGVVVYNNSTDNTCLLKTGGHIPSEFIDDNLSNGYVTINTSTGSFENTNNVSEAIGYYNGNLFIK